MPPFAPAIPQTRRLKSGKKLKQKRSAMTGFASLLASVSKLAMRRHSNRSFSGLLSPEFRAHSRISLSAIESVSVSSNRASATSNSRNGWPM